MRAFLQQAVVPRSTNPVKICSTFYLCSRLVIAARAANSELAILRSYRNPKVSGLLFDECTIWEACRATSAATTFFDPISIGKSKQRFIDGAIIYNNPVAQVYQEAKDVWPDRDDDNNNTLLISIGTGSAPGKAFEGNLKDIAVQMKRLVTQTERTADDFYRSHADMVNANLLFRFNVLHGLEDVGLEEYKEVDRIAHATQSYLDKGETRTKLTECVQRLVRSDSASPVDYPPPTQRRPEAPPPRNVETPRLLPGGGGGGGGSSNTIHHGNVAEGAIALYGSQSFSGTTQFGRFL